MGMIKRLTQHFKECLAFVDPDKRTHALRFFDKTKLIFEFYSSDFALVSI